MSSEIMQDMNVDTCALWDIVQPKMLVCYTDVSGHSLDSILTLEDGIERMSQTSV